MDDEDFDDLFAEAELMNGSSLESLNKASIDFDSHEAGPESTRESSRPGNNSIDNDILMSESPQQALTIVAVNSVLDQTLERPNEERPNSTVIEKIEKVFDSIADALLNEKNELAIILKTRVRPKRMTNPSNTGSNRVRRICFPGKTAEEAWRFTVVTRILELIHETLRNGVVMSKRDIYYRDPALFGSQAHVDRYINDIAFTFGVPRSMLNVEAVAKGLILGAVNFFRRDGSVFNLANDTEGLLVPTLRELLSINIATVKWILVIEKEATFRSIAASSFWETFSGEGVLITGKGYPDISTRALLHFLSAPSPQNGFASPPVYGLVDFDPDGLAILSVYKYGSLALSHENADLQVPQLQWLGLQSGYMGIGGDDLHASQGMLTLTPRDRRKAVKMLERNHSSENDETDDFQLRQALQNMLMLNMKAELQLLDANLNGMTTLLTFKFGNL